MTEAGPPTRPAEIGSAASPGRPLPEAFSTRRIQAVRLHPDDLGDLIAMHQDAEVSRFLGGVRTPAATADYLEVNLRHWDLHGFGLWTMRDRGGAFLGRAGLRHVEVEGREELEIAYAFVRSAWGVGLASEIAEALASIWRSRLAARDLLGLVMKGNLASERVLIRTGMVYERDATFHGEVCSLFRLGRAFEPSDAGAARPPAGRDLT